MLRGIPKRYLLVSWLFVLSAIAYLDRTNISIAGPTIAREFGINNTRLGAVFSAFLIGYAAFQVPAGLVVRRYGSRLVLAAAALWWGLFTVLTAAVPPSIRGAIPLLVLVRFGLGAGEATMYPATSHFVERWFPVAERGRANGIIFGGVGAGSGLAPPIVAFILVHYGWRASFWFSAVIGVLAGLVWYLAARDTPQISDRPPGLLQEAQPAETGALGVVRADAPAAKHKVPWTKLFTSKEILALTTSYFAFGYIAWVFFAWFYIYLAEVRGLNLKTSALYSTLPFLCMTVGCLLGGVASDSLAQRYTQRLGRCVLPAAAMAMTAVLLVLGSRAQSAEIAGLVLACGAGTLYIAQSCFWAMVADISGEYASVASGVMNMGAQIGGAVTASLTPWLAAHFGWHTPFYAAASLGGVGSVCWLLVNPRRRLDTAI